MQINENEVVISCQNLNEKKKKQLSRAVASAQFATG